MSEDPGTGQRHTGLSPDSRSGRQDIAADIEWGGNVGPERAVDWEWARARLRRLLRAKAGRMDEETLSDLTQEACLRLVRALRRSEARNLGALLSVIAQRTMIDFIRRRIFWGSILRPLEGSEEEVERLRYQERPEGGADPGRCGEALDRLRFNVLEFFEQRGASCHELAVAYFAEEDWSSVARRLGLRPETVRQRWSRCVRLLREAAGNEPGRFLPEAQRFL